MALNPSQLIQQFLRSISQESALYQALLNLQTQQCTLYVTFDAQALQENAEQQARLLTQLKQAAQQRSQCLQQLGLANDNAGVSRLFSALPTTLRQQAKQQWQTLAELVSRCQKLNQRNGQTSATFHEMVAEILQPSGDTYQEQW